MRLRFVTLFAAAALATSSLAAYADTITYTESAIGSGSLGKTDFTNALVTLTATGDTSSVVDEGGGVFVIILPVELTVEGLGSTMFTDTLQFVSNNVGLAGVGDNSDDQAVLFTTNSAFDSYNLQTGIGPLSGAPEFNAGDSFNTADGAFVTTSFGTSTFEAVVNSSVPEPSTIAMFGTGLLGLAGAARRKVLRRS